MKDWCTQSWSMAAQFGTPQVYFFKSNFENVQKSAASFVIGNYIYETGSKTGILEQLKWESLKKGGDIVES